MTQSFRYKPALFASHHTIIVSDAGITREKDGTSDIAAWQDISSIRYSVIGTHLGESHAIKFVLRNGRKLSINRNDLDERFDDESDVAYRQMFLAVLKGLVAHRPDLRLDLGQNKTVQWILFSLGLVCLLFAVAIVVLAWMDGKSSRLQTAIVPIGLMLVFGGGVAWNFHPFRAPIQLDPSLLIDKLKALDA